MPLPASFLQMCIDAVAFCTLNKRSHLEMIALMEKLLKEFPFHSLVPFEEV